MSSMSIAIHLGAPMTDNGQLLWSLRKDAHSLMENGVLVRRPVLYQKQVKTIRNNMKAGFVADEQRHAVLEGFLRGQNPSRIILSDAAYLGGPVWMLQGGTMFRDATQNLETLRNLFAEHQCEFFLGIRNPATLIPAVFRSQVKHTLESFLSGADLLTIRWSDLMLDILEACPDVPLTVWCNEETPALWPGILQAVAAQPDGYRFSGEMDVLEPVITEEGLKRLSTYLDQHPQLTAKQRMQVCALFLDKYPADGEEFEEIDLPGWSQDFVDEMTENYLDDIERIQDIEAIRFLSASAA